MDKQNIITSILLTIIGSSTLNGIITHILYNNKLKKELKSKGNDMVAQNIQSSLQSFRDLELMLTVQEIYDIETELETRGSNVNLFGGECIYPAIFNDWDSFNQFIEQIHTCRCEHEKNLSCKLALNLVFIDRYINQLSLFMSENDNELSLPFWGTIFIIDLQKWQKKIDKLLVKEINKYNYKLESHNTRKWNLFRKTEIVSQYNNTILHFLLTNSCPKHLKKRMTFLSTALNELLSDSSSE